MPRANAYIVTFATPDGPREVKQRAWNVIDAAQQAILEISTDYKDGAALDLKRVEPDESADLMAVLFAAALGRAKKDPE